MKISDKEYNKSLETMLFRGMREAIIGIRHCNFNDPSFRELKVIEHYTQVIEYFFHLDRYRQLSTRKMQQYRQRLYDRDMVIRKLRSRRTVTEWSSIPENFFEVDM